MSSAPSEPPPLGAGWTRSRIVFLALSGVGLVGLLAWTREVLLPFILAIIIAYVLTPAVAACERLRIPRALAILLVYVVTGVIVYLGIAATAPRIVEEAVQLSRETPALARRLANQWGPVIERRIREFTDRGEAPEPHAIAPPAFSIQSLEGGGYAVELNAGVELVREHETRWRLRPVEASTTEFSVAKLVGDGVEETLNYVKRNALELLHVGQVIVSRVARGVFLTFMTLMVAGYIMYTRDELMAFFRTLPPHSARGSFDRLVHRMDRGLSGVVRGQLVIMVVNGVLSAIGFWLFDLKYWPILALVAGLMSIIPIFGSILSTIPVVLIGLTQDFWTALWVLLWIVGIHQIEANLLNPNIIGVAAKLHPGLVVFSLLAGEHFYGLWGALLAVPILSLVKSVFNHFRFESMPDIPADSLALDGGGWDADGGEGANQWDAEGRGGD
jgi:predicted PurR-regulated permease PerM